MSTLLWLATGLVIFFIYLLFVVAAWIGVDQLNHWLARRRGQDPFELDEIERDDCAI